jgi:hypothetical protein
MYYPIKMFYCLACSLQNHNKRDTNAKLATSNSHYNALII